MKLIQNVKRADRSKQKKIPVKWTKKRIQVFQPERSTHLTLVQILPHIFADKTVKSKMQTKKTFWNFFRKFFDIQTIRSILNTHHIKVKTNSTHFLIKQKNRNQASEKNDFFFAIFSFSFSFLTESFGVYKK